MLPCPFQGRGLDVVGFTVFLRFFFFFPEGVRHLALFRHMHSFSRGFQGLGVPLAFLFMCSLPWARDVSDTG